MLNPRDHFPPGEALESPAYAMALEEQRRRWAQRTSRGQQPAEIVAEDMNNNLSGIGRLHHPRFVTMPTYGDKPQLKKTTLAVNSGKALAEYVVSPPSGYIRDVQEINVININMPNPHIRVSRLNGTLHFKYYVMNSESDTDTVAWQDWSVTIPNGDYMADQLIQIINEAIRADNTIGENAWKGGELQFVMERDASGDSSWSEMSGVNSGTKVKRQDAVVRLVNGTNNVSILFPSVIQSDRFMARRGPQNGSIWPTLGFPHDQYQRVIRSLWARRSGQISKYPNETQANVT